MASVAIWNQLRQSAQGMQTQLVAKKNDLKSGAFRDASMAMCALVAAADGSIDPEERRKVAALITSNEVLANFAADDLRARFEAYCTKITADFDFGRVTLLQEIGKTKKKPAEARAVIQIGIIIGGADGTFDDAERGVVREACFAVGISPQEFDL
jgi:tellurite resistance protein TerB